MRSRGPILALCLGLAGAARAVVPNPPSFVGITATGTAGELGLSWTAVANVPAVTAYVVYYSEDPNGIQDAVALTKTVDASFHSVTINVGGANDGDAYYAWVAAAETVDGVGGTATAVWADPVVQWPYQAADAPRSFTATTLDFGQGIQLAFDQPTTYDGTGLGGMEVLARGPGQTFTSVLLVDPGQTTAILDAAPLGCGTGIVLQARAIDDWGDPGNPSVPISVTPACAVKLTTNWLNGSGAISLSWTTEAKASSYRIYESSYSLAASPQLLTQSALAKAKGVVASGLAKGRPLFLRAAWLDASGTASPLSNEIDVLPPPQSLDVIPYSGGALVQWQSNLQTNMPVLGYAVYVTPGAGLPIDASTDTAYAFVYSPTFATNTASAVVKGLVPNNPYSFAVAAVTGARQWWTGTASASVGAGANMAFPTISEAKSVTLSPTTTGLQINWLASTDYAGSSDTAIAAATTVTYELRAVDAPPTATDPSQGVTRTVASTTNTAAVDVSRPAAASQEWYYVYVSVTGQGVGSSLASLTTAAGMVSLPVLDAPTMITATSVDNGRVQLSWSTVNSADHYQILRSTQGAAFAALADGLLSSLTGSGQSMSWIDAEAINNTPNAYEVEALLGLPPGVGGPAIPSAASNVVTGTPSVLPDMPGPSYMNVVAANGSDFQTVSGHAITAVASVTVPGEIDLVWASSGPGSAPVTGYQVLRGNSPDPTQMSYLTTVAALPATSTALVRYADGPTPAVPQPTSALWYAARSLAADGSVSNWVTATVGTAVPWGPPTLTVVNSRVGGVTLDIGASTSPGTYSTADQLIYWLVRCDQGPYLFGGGGLAVPVTHFSMSSLTVTSVNYTDTSVNPNLGTSPFYYALVQDTVSGLSSTAVPAEANLVLPPDWVAVPGPVSGLAGTVSQAVPPLTTGSAAAQGPQVNLTWFANPVPQGTSSPGLPVLLDYLLWVNGAPQTVSPVAGSPYVTYADNSLSLSASSWGGISQYRIQARNGKGYGLLSVTTTVALLPPEFSGVALAPLTSTSIGPTVTLNWNTQTASALAGFEVVRFQYAGTTAVPDATTFTYLTGSPTLLNTYTDTNLPGPGTQIGYAVGSVVYNGVTNTSSWDQGLATAVTQVALTVAPTPAVPTGLTVSPLVDGAQLGWAPATGASAYWIYRSTYAPGATLPDSALLQPVNVACCGYTDLTAPGQTTVYYSVAGANITSLGKFSSISTTPQQGAPTNLTVTPGWDYGLGQASFTLAWSPPVSAGDASTYTVYRATAPAGPTTMVVNNLTATSYVDEGGGTSLTPTAAYYYSVLDVNGVGAFSAATPAAAATAYPPLPGLSGLSVVGQGGGLFAAWNPLSPSSGVNGYYLNVSTLAGAQVASLVVPASQNTAFVALTGTALHMTLTVQVGGLNSAGQGPTLVAQGFANNALNGQVVQGVTGTVGYYEATTGAARVVLDFATPTSGTTLLYRDIAPVLVTESAGGPASPFYLAEVDGLDSYVDTTVAVFTNYYYAFTSLNKPGLPGGESPPVQLGPLSPIVAAGPGAISGTAGNGRVDLVYSAPASWGTHGPPGSASATAFLLYRQGAKATAAAPVGPSLTAADPGFPVSLSLASSAYTDTNVVNGYAYNYYLKAVDGAGWPSDQWAYPHLAAPYEDDIAPMVPLAPQPPPQNVTAVAGDASVTLRWVASQADADTSAFGGSSGTYNVYRRQVGAPNVGYTLLPWLQHVGPVPQDYSGGGTTNGLLVSTLTDPPEADFVSVPPYAPVDLQEYCYSISTVNSRGEGPKGPEVCITPFKPLAAPLNVSVTVAEGAYSRKSLFIGWSPPVANPVTYTGYPLVGYEVLRSSDEGTTYTLVNPSVNAGMVTGTSEVDSSTKFGTSYLYRVVAIDQAGNEGLSSQLVPAIIPTGTDAIHLYRNAFDPAKGQSLPVQYSTEEPGHVWVKVYTLSGEYVATLFDETVQSASSASPYLSAKIFWPGTNNLGQTVASGVYLIHLEGSGFRANARVAVIK